MKKKLRWIGLVLLSPFLLIALLAIALYLPPVQQWAVKQATAYASKQTGMQISVDRVRLRFPLDLGVEGIKVIKRNDSLPQVKDTVADIKTLVVNVQLRPLFHKQVMVDELSFRQMKLNTSTFIHEARIEGDIEEMKVKSHGIDLTKETVRVNDALLDGARLLVAHRCVRAYAMEDYGRQSAPEVVTGGRANAGRHDAYRCLHDRREG